MTGTILSVGAAGKFAGLVVPELAKRGAKVRGLIQDPKQGNAVLKAGAAEVVVGDLTDRASMDAALKGVDAVFYIPPAFIQNEAQIGESTVAAAKQAGVRRFVFSAVIHPILSVLSNHAAKAPVEEAVLASDMEFTFLQPAMFFQNYAGSWPRVVESGVYVEPWSAETCFSRVDYRDVAEVAALALTEDRLLFGTFELCAEGNLSRIDAAALMSEALGREIQAGSIPPKPPASGSPAGNPQAAMQPMLDWYNHHGLLGNPLTLRAILGREPRSLRSYFEELAAAPQTP